MRANGHLVNIAAMAHIPLLTEINTLASLKKVCPMVRALMTLPMGTNTSVGSSMVKDTVKAVIFMPMGINMWVGLS